jgi:hypothetical protein
MTALERRCRLLLLAYPAWYRRERGEEILATLLECSQPSQRWPAPRDAGALILSGLRVRAGQHERLSTAANLRLAVLLGVALSLLGLIANDLSAQSYAGNSHQAVFGMIALAAVVSAWFAPLPVVAALAVTSGGLWVWWGDRVMVMQPSGLLMLICLAILACGKQRLPRSWLWLAAAMFAAQMLPGLTIHILRSNSPLFVPLVFVPLIILGAVVLWAAIDARPVIAMAIYLLFTFLISPLANLAAGGPSVYGWVWYPPIALAAVLVVPGIWRLRRQAVLLGTR